ncbi:MAG: mechanosensitive ion channel [Coriobacteriia bacterium]|nr:mechanosensitive ion channel [Coriobacteriia bacterium]
MLSRKVLAAAVALLVVGAVTVALAIACIHPMQSVGNLKQNFPGKLESARELVTQTQEDVDAVYARYDGLYQSKADAVAFFAQNKKGFAYSNAQMNQLFGLLDVDALLVVDENGKVVARSGAAEGLAPSAAKAAAMVLTGQNGGFAPFDVQAGDGQLRLYASAVDAEHVVVVAKQPSQIAESVSRLASVELALRDVTVGETGFVVAVDDQGIIRAHADADLVGTPAADAGLTPEQLADDFAGDVTMGGQRYVAQTCACGDYVLMCALPYAEINSFTSIYVCLGVAVYLIAAGLLLAFLYFAATDRRRRKDADDAAEPSAAALRARAIPVGVGCLVFALAASLYLSTLVELSGMMVSNDQHAASVKARVEAGEKTAADIDAEATRFVKDKAVLSAYMLPRFDAEQLTRPFMVQMRKALACDTIWYFDLDGNTIASDNDFWGYRLNDDPESFSYQFREVLEGRKSEVVVDSESQTGDWSMTRYVGMAVQDKNLRTTGMVEIGSDQTLVNRMKEALSFGSFLESTQPGNNTFAFAVDAESSAFAYHPNQNLVGSAAADHGIVAQDQVAGFSGFLTVDGQSYLCSSVSAKGSYVYVATPAGAVTGFAVPAALLATGLILLWLLILLLALPVLFRRLQEAGESAGGEEASDSSDDQVEVMVDGRAKRTVAAVGRWSMRGVSWASRTPGQKVAAICRVLFSVLALVFLVMFLLADVLFDEASLFRYILNGSWEPGLNLYAITRCVVVLLVAYSVVDIVRRLLRLFAKGMSAKGETICRLLDNVLKFAFWIAMLYFCMGTLGADTSVLLTSAGILTLVVGLGANSLITDVLAGLFIVFEGEFRVGDIIKIGDFRGTVQEIGVRTTKVEGADNNVKVFANRNVTGVVNMTKDLSSVACTFTFPATMSLERMEVLLSRQFPRIRKELPQIVDGPFYRGVTEQSDSSVSLQIVAKCHESDRGQLERELNREIRLIAERYLLGPDAQANALEHIAADRFKDDQAEASKSIDVESDK